jgi:LemA protein
MVKEIAIIIVALLVVGIIGYFIQVFNRLVLLKNDIEKAFANIDVSLKQRADEIPNIVSVVKAYSIYEKSTLETLTKLRMEYLNSVGMSSKVQLAKEMDASFQKFFVVAENYPELKADSTFLKLQQRITELENIIADRREFFNESVNLYNIGIQEFPDLIFAKLLGYVPKNMLLFTDID